MSLRQSRASLSLAAVIAAFALLLGSVPSSAANAAWAFRVAGSGDDEGYAIGVDAAGNTYVGGEFENTVDFDPRSTVDRIVSQGGEDGFLASYTPDKHLRWAFAIGGTGYDTVAALVVSGTSVTIVGSFTNTVDLDPGPALDRFTSKGSQDGFVLRVRQSDGGLVWAGTIGGTGFDELKSVAVDALGNVLLAGHFTGTADLDPTSAVHQVAATGAIDTFVTKVGADESFQWTSAIHGGQQVPSSVAAGPGNEVLYAGWFTGTVDLDPGPGTQTVTSNGGNDAFLVTLSATGAFVRGATFGGAGDDGPSAVIADGTGNTWLTGTFEKSVDFDPGPAVHKRTAKGSTDIFVVELGAAGQFIQADRFGGSGLDASLGMARDAAGNLYFVGYFGSKVDFDPSSDVFNLTPVGGDDIFNLELSSTGAFRDAWSMGGAGNEGGRAIAALGQSVYSTGWYYAAGDFDPGPGTVTLHQYSSAGDSDAFVVRVTH
jgi:hypothetical protein